MMSRRGLRAVHALIIVAFTVFSMTTVYAEASITRENDTGMQCVLSTQAMEVIEELSEVKEVSKQGRLLKKYNNIVDIVGLNVIGGAYFDENENLHVISNDLTISRYCDDDEVVFEYGKYSYNELMSQINIIAEMKSELMIDSIELNQVNNCLDVYVKQSTETSRTVINSSELSINDDIVNLVAVTESSDIEFLSTYTISGGDLLTYDSNGDDWAGSIGCAVLYNRSGTPARGFLTAAHVPYGPNGDMYYAGADGDITPVYIGSVAEDYFQLEGSVDACIIQDESEDTLLFSGETGDGRLITHQQTAPLPFYTRVYAYGAVSGGMSGLVKGTGYSFTVDGIEFTNFMKTTISATNGDSGGPVVCAYDDAYSMVGIISMGRDESDGRKTYVCQIQEINEAFDSSVST